MKYNDIANKSSHERSEMLKDKQSKLGKLRFELANKTLKDYSQIEKTRREIAQLMTSLREKN